MTPGAEGASFALDPGSPRQLGNQEVRNEVANLPQQVHLCSGWNVLVVFFIPAVWQDYAKHSSFFEILWDGCEINKTSTAITQGCGAGHYNLSVGRLAQPASTNPYWQNGPRTLAPRGRLRRCKACRLRLPGVARVKCKHRVAKLGPVAHVGVERLRKHNSFAVPVRTLNKP